MTPQAVGLLAAAFGAAISVLAAAIGIGKIGSSSAESIARQPEAAQQIRGTMIITAALIEGVTLFALAICFLVQNKITL